MKNLSHTIRSVVAEAAASRKQDNQKGEPMVSIDDEEVKAKGGSTKRNSDQTGGEKATPKMKKVPYAEAKDDCDDDDKKKKGKKKAKDQVDFEPSVNDIRMNVEDKNLTEAKIKIGDMVHIGLAQRGGAGYRGKVTKIDGDSVWVESTKSGKFGPRTWKGNIKNVTLVKNIANEEVEQVDEISQATQYRRDNPKKKYAVTMRNGSVKYVVADSAESAKDQGGYNAKSVQLVQHEQLEEMTDAQMKKREEIVKSMKKNASGFKARYGDRAKNIMYATANKLAQKEGLETQFTEADFEELDEDLQEAPRRGSFRAGSNALFRAGQTVSRNIQKAANANRKFREGLKPGDKISVSTRTGSEAHQVKSLDDRYVYTKSGLKTSLQNVFPLDEETELEEGMPSTIIKHKQRLANMDNKTLKKTIGHKSEDELRSMAWRHGYGKNSDHYVKRLKEETELEEAYSMGYKTLDNDINRLAKLLTPRSQLAKGMAKSHGNDVLRYFKEMERAMGTVYDVWERHIAPLQMNEETELKESKGIRVLNKGRNKGKFSHIYTAQAFDSRKEAEADYARRKKISHSVPLKDLKPDPNYKPGSIKEARRRGRPSKDEADEAENIIMQLRKSVSLRGMKDVMFDDGKKANVSMKDAQAALKKFNLLKRAEDKEAYMKKLSASHDSLKKNI